jgi:hypothetical protein
VEKSPEAVEAALVALKEAVVDQELKNEDFKTLYLINEEDFKTSVYWKMVNTMFLEVNKRL